MEEAWAAAGGVGRRHRPHGAVVEEAGANISDSQKETDTALV
jgi:hypothetical protein